MTVTADVTAAPADPTPTDPTPPTDPVTIGAEHLQHVRESIVWGDRIRLERLLRRWSQHDLARVAGCTQPQVSRIENGAQEISRTTCTKIARAFGLQAAELFPYDDAPPPTPRDG